MVCDLNWITHRLAVDSKLILEVKAVEEMNRIYKAQVLTYLKLTGLRLGLLINST